MPLPSPVKTNILFFCLGASCLVLLQLCIRYNNMQTTDQQMINEQHGRCTIVVGYRSDLEGRCSVFSQRATDPIERINAGHTWNDHIVVTYRDPKEAAAKRSKLLKVLFSSP